MSDLCVGFSLDISPDECINFGVTSLDNGGLNEYINTLLVYDIGEAKVAKNDTKKLVRTLFGSDKKR